MELGKSFYAKLVAGIFAIGILAFLGFVLFERAVYRYGIIGGTVIVVGILLLIAYFYDRKHARTYDEEGND
jgi:integral membrane sensor domain MASE1